MKPLVAFALAAVLFAACAKHEAPPPARPEVAGTDDSAERSSLLELAHGATVIARSGEVMLEVSALRTIDGEPSSFWMNPPRDLPQSVTVTLPARSRIDKIGIRTVARGAFTANHVTFASSIDGKTFAPVTTVKSADSSDAQWFDVQPFEAIAVRVTIDDCLLPGHDVRLNSVLARGTELEPPHPGDLAGCWTVNGERARFVRNGNHVTGVLETGKEPMRFDGGFDGRIYRLNWIRGKDYGMSLITVSPDGQHLSGMNWHEEAIPMFFDTSWFGTKETCSGRMPDPGDVMIDFLYRAGRLSLYGHSAADLVPLLKRVPNVQLVAQEFRFATAKENREATERALAEVRRQLQAAGVDMRTVTYVASGSDGPRQLPVTDVMRALYSTVDVEVRR